MRTTRDSSGQALLELVFGGGLILACLVGCGLILERAYLRWECARSTFEAARGAVQGSTSFRPWIRITRHPDGVEARRDCRTGTERVFLPSLETWSEHASR